MSWLRNSQISLEKTRQAIFDTNWAREMSLVSSPLGWTFHSAVRHATKGDRHRHISSIFGRLVPKMDIGA